MAATPISVKPVHGSIAPDPKTGRHAWTVTQEHTFAPSKPGGPPTVTKHTEKGDAADEMAAIRACANHGIENEGWRSLGGGSGLEWSPAA